MSAKIGTDSDPNYIIEKETPNNPDKSLVITDKDFLIFCNTAPFIIGHRTQATQGLFWLKLYFRPENFNNVPSNIVDPKLTQVKGTIENKNTIILVC